MKQMEAKACLIQEWRAKPESERTESAAAAFCLFHSGVEDPYFFKCSGDRYQVIMGWISPYIVK